MDALAPRIVHALATCHSITRINGRLDGDPLDLKLFEFTLWQLIEPSSDETTNFDCLMPTIVRSAFAELGILRQFPFASSLQRMGVVVKCLRKVTFEFYCKGSPEIIRSLCADSTVPKNFNTVLNRYPLTVYLTQ